MEVAVRFYTPRFFTLPRIIGLAVTAFIALLIFYLHLPYVRELSSTWPVLTSIGFATATVLAAALGVAAVLGLISLCINFMESLPKCQHAIKNNRVRPLECKHVAKICNEHYYECKMLLFNDKSQKIKSVSHSSPTAFSSSTTASSRLELVQV